MDGSGPFHGVGPKRSRLRAFEIRAEGRGTESTLNKEKGTAIIAWNADGILILPLDTWVLSRILNAQNWKFRGTEASLQFPIKKRYRFKRF